MVFSELGQNRAGRTPEDVAVVLGGGVHHGRAHGFLFIMEGGIQLAPPVYSGEGAGDGVDVRFVGFERSGGGIHGGEVIRDGSLCL